MDSAFVYAFPSISAIAIKIVLLWYGRHFVRSASPWVCMFLFGLFGVNLCEMLSFFYVHDVDHPTAYRLLVGYYIAALASGAGYCYISVQLADRFIRFFRVCILCLLFIGIVTLVVPNAALTGVQSIGYSATRIAGPFYWILQLLIPLFWLAGGGALLYATHKGGNWLKKRRALALLYGSSPLLATIMVVMVLMQAGASMNATVVVSLAINVLLATLIYTEYESGIFRFLSYIPRTQEHQLVVYAARSAHDLASHGLSGAVANFERALIDNALRRCKGNKTGAANLLGVSRTTLRRKMSS